MADGYYDPTWIGGGRTTFSGDYQNASYASATHRLLVDATGNLILLGRGSVAWLGGMQPDGQWIATFGVPWVPAGTGRVTSAIGFDGTPGAMAIEPDGNYVIIGQNSLSRVLALAPNSGAEIPVSVTGVDNTQGQIFGSAIAVQPDGKILIAGAGYLSKADTTAKFGIARLNSSDFSLDTTFKGSSPPPPNGDVVFSGGAVVAASPADAQEVVTDVLLQPDGRIVLVGSGGFQLELVRLNADGGLDSTFGTGGTAVLTWPSGTIEAVHRASLDRAGRVVIALQGKLALESQDLLLVARVTSTGQLDSTFGADNGFARASLLASCSSIVTNAVSIDSAGRILALGDCNTPTGAPPPVYFIVARLRGDTGYPDGSFGVGGFGLGLYAASAASAFLNNALAFDASGHPVVGGQSDNGNAGVARLTYDLIHTNNFESVPRGCL
ncbi:MAG TPA: hypothetical protein VHQ21_13630, partial [Rhodanobacteraceae bacterium]|nr:hypothetical protein [Rhodanobacteraceae bacterium]